MPPHNVRTGRQAVWNAIRTLNADDAFIHGWTRGDILRLCSCTHKTIREYVEGLLAAGYLRHPDENRYVLVRDPGAEAPRLRGDGTEVTTHLPREQMWRAFKFLNTFRTDELALVASTEKAPVSETAARIFAAAMARAGYLRIARKRPVQYAVLRHKLTGPKPPIIRNTGEIIDANDGLRRWPQPDAAPTDHEKKGDRK